jgi:hypothetical protein
MLVHIDDLEADMGAFTARIEAATATFEAQCLLLESIPGVGRHSAEVIPP